MPQPPAVQVTEEAAVALRVVTMGELRLGVLVESERTGETVTEICRRYGISGQTYYRYRKRYLAEGLEGLEDRRGSVATEPPCRVGGSTPGSA
jgi:transposase-like protein